MADTNAQMEELARILEQVNYEMAQYGKITKQTADDKFDAEVKAATGISNATKSMDKFGDAVGYVASAAMSSGKAMLEGKKGATAFNESVDDMAKAAAAAGVVLTLMVPGGPLLKLFFAGVTAAVGAVAAYTKATNTMADQLYKTYSGLSKAGASASDGMTGVKKASDQLGLSVGEMDVFVGQIAANSKDLALFSGSVFEGRQKIGDMGEALKGSREDFLKMGMSMADVSEGMMGYLKIQTRLGQSQNKTTAELADGAKKYLVEQDALSKLTGQTRKEMEDQRERALQGEQFAAKIRQLQLEGNDKAAQELLKMNSIYEAAGPKMAAAFQASVTGNLSNADAQEANLASNGAMLETTQKVIAGQMSYTDAVTITGTAMGKTADTVGVVLGQFGAYNDSFGPINEQLKLAQLAQGDITANMAKIKEDQKKVLEGGADKLLENQARLINAQIDANKQMEAFVFQGIAPAQEAMEALAKATNAAGQFLNDLTGSKGLIQRTIDMIGAKDSKDLAKVGGNETFGEIAGGVGGGVAAGAIAGGLVGSIVPVVGTAIGAAIGGALGAWGGSKLGGTIGKYVDETTKAESEKPATGKPIEKRASGGPVDAKTPYLIGENGPELFVPSASGDVMSNSAMKALGNINNTMPLPTLPGNMKNAMSMLPPMPKLPGDMKNAMPMADAFKDTENSFDKILSSLTVVSKTMTTGSKELDESFDEIVKDSLKLERLTDADTKRAEKYSVAYKSYVDLKTQLMDLETPDLKAQIDILQQKAAAAGVPDTGNAGGAPGGAGLKLPAAGSMPAMGGGQGVAGGIASQQDLTKMGLKLKQGDVQAEDSKIDPKIIELAQQVQANMPNFAYFSGFNDKFHQEKSPSSSHTSGRAMDFALSKEPSVEEGKEITKWLKSMGASVAIDEYNNPSSKATAGHIHAQIPGYADGGLASTPQIAMVAEKGPEAMIPLDNGAIPINLEMPDVKKMFEGMAQAMREAPEREVTVAASTDNRAMAEMINVMREQTAELVSAMSDMIREQKNSISVQERILQTSM